MDSMQGLIYVTLDISDWDNLPPSYVVEKATAKLGVGEVTGATGAFVYFATDAAAAGAGKPQWLVMWESSDIDHDTTAGPRDAREQDSGTAYHQDLFALQSTYTSPSFTSAELQAGSATNYIVAVVIRLDEAFKEEYDRYYAEEHIGGLMEVPGWRRTRRYVEAGRSGEGDAERSKGEVKILQLHDYDPDGYGVGGEEFKRATSTEWYRRMMEKAVVGKDRRTYELCGYVSLRES
ncbi:hypothetical protein N3K66_006139 [Trichothecium roseum]|uniref:Uncharacterized protein n=1 Tax=Trichothecium roseum TaxID=47278 RepID=A0ACC0UZT3_9HYPO|nr:hypothetical protein N3K66_006139 [Trichothecium roseum]